MYDFVDQCTYYGSGGAICKEHFCWCTEKQHGISPRLIEACMRNTTLNPVQYMVSGCQTPMWKMNSMSWESSR